MSGKKSGEIRLRNREGFQIFDAIEDDERAAGFDRNPRDVQFGETLEAAEPDSGELLEAVDGGEGAEIGGELGGEADGGDGAVDELQIRQGGEGLEGGEGQCDIVGAIRELEGDQVAEGVGAVADGGGAVEGRARVLSGGDIQRLESSQLLRVEGGGGGGDHRRRWFDGGRGCASRRNGGGAGGRRKEE
ncbi:hypothetical protein DM860_008005 [Cuscuta australis]|uniref:Uncharacterized protein n=1 Tax=Cuscuta australis TaxID=267555 RepID=A0A328E1K6_9ASTE|nr:hypothetical protein DM860_008005 [Cuscuta australis]